jgi:uncharacterized protein with NAD-binding domain and iron-sulfur cluster
MSAAHELAERGFTVRVFERQLDIPGGKARSVPVPDSATGGRAPLPGEHGFRFFPGFYRHVTDTMKRIPFRGNRQGAFDNLVPSTKVMMARHGYTPIVTMTRFPRSFADVRTLVHALADSHTGLTNEEKEFFAARTWQLMTSCAERRANDYERLSWWQYMAADRFSENYRALFVIGLTRTLVAARAQEASTKTGGDIFIQLIFNMANPSISADRVLNGPTNAVWLDPWLEHLRSVGVDYQFGATVESIDCREGRIAGVDVRRADGSLERVAADYYVAAMPVERMAPLITEAMLAADPTLEGVRQLATDVAWMNGIQFYLKEDVVINEGHVIYPDSPWALTSISQVQFWKDFDISAFGDGTVKSVLSVDVSDWQTPGLNGKPASDCLATEVRDEVLAQLENSLSNDPDVDLRADHVVNWYLDRDITFDDVPPAKTGTRDHNAEPLLVNKVQTWDLRPNAITGIPNLFLASDYVRTYTDLATMEGANEAARRAVNGIIEASGVREPLCEIWNLHEPLVLAPLRYLDRRRYRQGLPWRAEFPWVVRALHWILAFIHGLVSPPHSGATGKVQPRRAPAGVA